MIPGPEALERLLDGNRRYATGARNAEERRTQARREEVASGQNPFAVVLGCSDSRVPVEIVFDQGLGDLFVIRVAGNVVAPTQIESIEFAVDSLGARLVVVLGHTRCGAVQATLDGLRGADEGGTAGFPSIVSRIRPAVEGLLAADPSGDPELLMQEAVRANVRFSTRQVRAGSKLLEARIREDGLLVVGAEYSIESGVVDFFDRVPGVD